MIFSLKIKNYYYLSQSVEIEMALEKELMGIRMKILKVGRHESNQVELPHLWGFVVAQKFKQIIRREYVSIQ